MPDITRHTKADEDASWWWEQIVRAKNVYKEVQNQHYRTPLKRIMDLSSLGYGHFVESMAGDVKTSVDDIQPVDILYLPRWLKWVESQAFDFRPEIKYPRYSTPDTKYGDMMGELLTRVGDECNEMREWRGTIADAATDGCFAIWYGVDADAVDQTTLHDSQKPIGQIVAEGAAGATVARPGQDHAMVSEVALDQALGGEDPESQFNAKMGVLGPGGEEQQENLLRTASAHDVAKDKESKAPRDWKRMRSAVWCQRRPVGECTLWDPDADDFEDARWVARKFTQNIDIARSSPAYKPSIAALLEPGVWREGHGHVAPADESAQTKGVQSNKIAIWEIWDRLYNERHYITQDQKSFLEKSARDPHAYDNGKPGVRGFIPCVIEAPQKPVASSPRRPYGIPTAAIGYPAQRLLIELATHNLDAVKKLTVRQWTYDEDIDAESLEVMQSGITGRGIKRPTGYDGNGLDIVTPLNYGNVPPEVFQQVMWAKNEMAALLAWPISQMTGSPVADTATAEQISVTAGSAQLGDFIRCLEDSFARGQMIKRDLIKRWYSDGQIDELLGDEHLEGWRLWKASPVKGDRIEVIFEPRTRGEDAVRRKQIGDVLMLAMEMKYPGTELPRYETDHLMQEWVRLHGLGKLIEHKYSDEQLEVEANRQINAAGIGAEGNGKATGGNDKRSRGQNPASNQQTAAATQRVGPSRGGPGRGMPPG